MIEGLIVRYEPWVLALIMLKHPTCCPKPEIQITGMTGRRIVLEL